MAKLTFFDLLGVADPLAAAMRWPRTAIGSATGLSMSGDDPQEFVALMQFLQESLAFTGVRSGGDAEHSGFWAELNVEPSLFALDRPLVAANLPEFAFVLEATGPLPATVFVTRSMATGETDVVVQGLPVRVVFPRGYLEPQRTEEELALPPPLPPKRVTDAFDPSAPDSLEITLGDAEPSFIRVRINARLSAAGDVYIDTVVPVSIGPCFLLALPCRAVHDMQLVPSPALVDVPSELPFEWKRHSFGPMPELGLSIVTFRTIDLDPKHPTIAELMAKIRAGRSEAAAVEFVLEDVAVAQPIPLHARFGLRRAVVAPTESATEIFNLNNAPARIEIGPLAVFIYRLMLQTVPLDGSELPIAFDVSVASDDATPTGGRSVAVSVDEKGLIVATLVLREDERPRVMTLAGRDRASGGHSSRHRRARHGENANPSGHRHSRAVTGMGKAADRGLRFRDHHGDHEQTGGSEASYRFAEDPHPPRRWLVARQGLVRLDFGSQYRFHHCQGVSPAHRGNRDHHRRRRRQVLRVEREHRHALRNRQRPQAVAHAAT